MKFREKLDKLLGRILIVIMSLMVVNVLWQVFTRFVVGTPSSFTDELARYLMIWVGVLGAAYVAGKNQHVSIDVFANKLSMNKQKKLSNFVGIIIILFAITALVIGGIRLVYISHILGQHSSALQIPLAYVYMVIPISGILVIYYKISDILNRAA